MLVWGGDATMSHENPTQVVSLSRVVVVVVVARRGAACCTSSLPPPPLARRRAPRQAGKLIPYKKRRGEASTRL